MENPQPVMPRDEEYRGPWMIQPISQASSPHLHNQTRSPNRTLRGLDIWHYIQIIWDRDRLKADLFRSLSVAEVNSFRILLEWWKGKIQKSPPSEKAREQLRAISDIDDTGKYVPFRIYDRASVAGSDIEPDENIKSAEHVGSNYNEQLFILFQQEFCGYNSAEVPNTSWLQLHTQRQKCAELAACQRMAHSLCCSSISEDLVGGEGEMREQMSNHISASIHPCPWLSPRKADDTQLPRYLWDVASKCTILVETLAKSPQYVTISHTWGRWREDPKDKPPIKISGVNWKIPQNKRFDVQSLPNDLEKLPLSCPYVWLDLLCIPQDDRNEAREEIARQAAIFTGAASSIVWLNEIESWERTENVIQCFAYQYLQLANLETCNLEETEINERVEKAAKASQERIDFWNPADRCPSGWFTSLWTLQEACLRPDMYICNKSWKFLTLNRVVPVLFDAMIAISQMVFKFFASKELIQCLPKGSRDLLGILMSNGMDSLLGMSQQEVLVLGDQRQCTGRRAEAIMSVLGTTDWYVNQANQPAISPQDEKLVLGKYPLNFVKEVKEKVGAVFFSASTHKSFLERIRNQESGSRPEAWGTLLPFHSGVGNLPKYSPLQNSRFTNADPTVKCWTVESDGSVTIPCAAIIARTDDTNDFRAAIFGPDVADAIQEDMSFREFFTSVMPNLPKYAIQIATAQQGDVLGIILMHISQDSDYLVKISDFGIKSDKIKGYTPTIDQCQWHVL